MLPTKCEIQSSCQFYLSGNIIHIVRSLIASLLTRAFAMPFFVRPSPFQKFSSGVCTFLDATASPFVYLIDIGKDAGSTFQVKDYGCAERADAPCTEAGDINPGRGGS